MPVFDHPDFVLLDKGRTSEEKSVILVEKGQYAGYGYVDNSEQISSPSEFRNYIRQQDHHPDASDLVKGFLKQGKNIRKALI